MSNSTWVRTDSQVTRWVELTFTILAKHRPVSEHLKGLPTPPGNSSHCWTAPMTRYQVRFSVLTGHGSTSDPHLPRLDSFFPITALQVCEDNCFRTSSDSRGHILECATVHLESGFQNWLRQRATVKASAALSCFSGSSRRAERVSGWFGMQILPGQVYSGRFGVEGMHPGIAPSFPLLPSCW